MSDITEVAHGDAAAPSGVGDESASGPDGHARPTVAGGGDGAAVEAAPPVARSLSDNDDKRSGAAPAIRGHRRLNEWNQAKESFSSIMDEAGAAIRMFDQEKRRVLGLTQALSQIDQSFDKLHGRFSEIEKRVSTFVDDRARLDQRLESAFEAIRGCEDSEAELRKENSALRAAVAHCERRLAQYADSIQMLTEENRMLRDKLDAVEHDNGLIIDEIARIRDEIVLLNGDKGADIEDDRDDLEAVLEADGVAVADALPPTEPPAVIAPAEPVAPVAAPTVSAVPPGDLGDLIADITRSIAFHKQELSRLGVQLSHLPERAPIELARAGETPAGAAPLSPRALADQQLVELTTLLGSYQKLVQDLEQSRAALIAAPAATPVAAPAPASEPLPHVEAPAANPAPVGEEMPAATVWRTQELKTELARERQERRFAEAALQVARAERAQLQRELARVRANGWRTISAEPGAEPSPSPDGRETSAA